MFSEAGTEILLTLQVRSWDVERKRNHVLGSHMRSWWWSWV